MFTLKKAAVVGVIPARLASTRCPEKMLRFICGKPLILRTFENVSAMKCFDAVYVATDSQKIADLIGDQAIMTNPHCPNGTERILEAVQKDKRLQNADIIVNVQGDEPLLEEVVVSSVIEALKKDGDAVVATAVTPLMENVTDPSIVKCVIDQKGRALYFSRSPIPGSKSGKPDQRYLKHLGIYAYRSAFLPIYASLSETPLQRAEDLEQLKILEHGYTLTTATVTSASIGVDTPDDFIKLENLLCKKNTSSSPEASARLSAKG